jgi:hypothetical protein
MTKDHVETPDRLRQMESILEELNEGVVILDDQLRVNGTVRAWGDHIPQNIFCWQNRVRTASETVIAADDSQ